MKKGKNIKFTFTEEQRLNANRRASRLLELESGMNLTKTKVYKNKKKYNRKKKHSKKEI